MATDLDPATVVSAINSIATLLRHLSDRVGLLEDRLDRLEADKQPPARYSPSNPEHVASRADLTPKANQARHPDASGITRHANDEPIRQQTSLGDQPVCSNTSTCDIRRHLEPMNNNIQLLTTHVLRLEKAITQTPSHIPRPAKGYTVSSTDSGNSNHSSWTLVSQSKANVTKLSKSPSSTASVVKHPVFSPIFSPKPVPPKLTKPTTANSFLSGPSSAEPWPAASSSTTSAYGHGYVPPVFGQASTPASSVKNFGIDVSASPFRFYAGAGGASPFGDLAKKKREGGRAGVGDLGKEAALFESACRKIANDERAATLGKTSGTAILGGSVGRREGLGPARRQSRTSLSPAVFKPPTMRVTRRSLPALSLGPNEKMDMKFSASPMTSLSQDHGYKRCSLLGATPHETAEEKMSPSFGEKGLGSVGAGRRKRWSLFDGSSPGMSLRGGGH